MTTDDKLTNAQDTCNGLHRLVLRLNAAAVDIDRGGSIYELSGLIAALNDCVLNLNEQLTTIESDSETSNQSTEPALDTVQAVTSNVTPLKPTSRPADSVVRAQRVASR